MGREPRRAVDAEAKGAFIAAVRRGCSLPDAAIVSGSSLSAFYKARRADPAFLSDWLEALDVSAGPLMVLSNNNRQLQKRRMRAVRFNAERREIFLEHFAATADFGAAAEAAGVHISTAMKRRRRDPAFAAECQIALEQAYATLEAEALRQRLAAQQRIAERMEEGFETSGETGMEFERVMKLLARFDRRGGVVGFRERAPEHGRNWSIDEAIDALEAKMKAIGIEIKDVAPEPGDDHEVE